MLRRVFAAALIASLAACQAENGDPAGSASPTGEPPAAAPAAPPATNDTPLPKANPDRPEEDAPPVNESEPAATECGADKLDRWLNVLPTSTVKDEIAKAVGERPIRYIEPGGVVTMDLRPERLNVETGVDGRIKLFRCG